MKAEKCTAPADLARALDALGIERGGRVACLVLFTGDKVEMIYPGGSSDFELEAIDGVVFEALVQKHPGLA